MVSILNMLLKNARRKVGLKLNVSFLINKANKNLFIMAYISFQGVQNTKLATAVSLIDCILIQVYK